MGPSYDDNAVAPGIVAICGLHIALTTIFLLGRLLSNLSVNHTWHLDDCGIPQTV